MKKKILQTIRKHNLITDGMHIVVGLSGGPDSVCLFDLLMSLREELNLTLHAVHVNHKLRPGAAEDDQAYVEELCSKNKVACSIFTVDCKEMASELGLTSEEAGRKARYEAFGKAASEILERGITKEKIAIAVAHNANDQCETILFRLMRGTGTDGLAGIPYKRFDERGFAVIRPILDFKRSEIEEYCRQRGLRPRIDHTNEENLYARNRIRNMLIPFLQDNFNENVIDTVNRLGRIAASDREYLKEQAVLMYNSVIEKEEADCQILNGKTLSELHQSIRFRVYTHSLNKIGLNQNLTYAQGEAVDAVLTSDSPSTMCDLSEGYIARKEYDKLVFEKKDRALNLKGWNIRVLTCEEYVEYKDKNRDKVYGAFQGVSETELMIRTRKQGDRIALKNGSKKLQDFFVDQKVPKHYRDKLLVLAKGSEVLWVLPSEVFSQENMRLKGRFSSRHAVSVNSSEPIIILENL